MNQYSPRRYKRRGISQGSQLFLNLTLAIAILLQVAYPLVDGETLRLLTLATVYFAAGAMLLHAYLAFGWRYVTTYIAITFTFALAIEQMGVRTGWPFGSYSYDPSLAYQIFGVPLVVPFAWMMMAHPVLVVARRITKNWVFLVGGFAMMGWDLFLDPQMVAAHRWTWTLVESGIPFEPEIPISNAAGWLFAGMGLIALLHATLPRERRKGGAGFSAVEIFIAWTFFAGVIGNFFFFDRPAVGLWAGIIFACTYGPYAFTRWLGRP
ncbi:unannotated protein [freshwater metagenome]|uniref:Unannotated protein n=1 Tax=freshwater metagenome TaxID=449393 RepID=A0A6J6LUK7_9ZZZZ|nr:carotenoid biosynthesis protein [Actinomycetota bacterium]MSY54971.1 carotenoid biosynthesis protein [Actinomycetota bacterium]MTA68229.1 carotenoid biosynthesis protein [Actinomycetota bacterium]